MFILGSTNVVFAQQEDRSKIGRTITDSKPGSCMALVNAVYTSTETLQFDDVHYHRYIKNLPNISTLHKDLTGFSKNLQYTTFYRKIKYTNIKKKHRI